MVRLSSTEKATTYIFLYVETMVQNNFYIPYKIAQILSLTQVSQLTSIVTQYLKILCEHCIKYLVYKPWVSNWTSLKEWLTSLSGTKSFQMWMHLWTIKNIQILSLHNIYWIALVGWGFDKSYLVYNKALWFYILVVYIYMYGIGLGNIKIIISRLLSMKLSRYSIISW
jgi:hypothetical protein